MHAYIPHILHIDTKLNYTLWIHKIRERGNNLGSLEISTVVELKQTSKMASLHIILFQEKNAKV